MKRKQARKFAVLMSILLALGSFGVSASAQTIYEPEPSVTPPYTGALTWVNFTESGVPGPGMTIPYSMAIDSDDSVYATRLGPNLGTGSSSGKIEKLTDNGHSVTNVTYNSAVTGAIGIAVDDDKNLYVTDNTMFGTISGTNVARILKLSSGSNTWTDITHGATFRYAMGIAADYEGNVYTVDSSNNTSGTIPAPRILKLSEGATTWTDITNSAFASIPNVVVFDIAVDGEGSLFIGVIPSSSGLTSGKILKLKAGTSSWTDVTPAASPSASYPFIPYGIGIDKFDNLFAVSFFTGSVYKLGYNGGSNDWTEIQAVPAFPGSIFDVAADSSGYVYGTSISKGNISALRASVIYNGNGNTSGTVPVDEVGYKPDETATVMGKGELAKTGNTFAGWDTDASATTAVYAPGDSINMTQSVNLYAVWSPVSEATLSDIYLDEYAYTLPIGGTHQSVVTAVYSDDSMLELDSGVTFSSDNTEVATVDEYGVVTAHASGEAVITAEYEDKQAQATVTVSSVSAPILTGIELDAEAYTLSIGETHSSVVTAVYSNDSTFTLNSGVTFSSENTDVATVDESGLVTAKTSGSSVITATYGGKNTAATVTVRSNSNPVNTEEDSGVEIFVDGVKQEKLATAKKSTENGQEVMTVILDSQKVVDKLNRENNKLLTIPVTGNSDVVVGQLNGSLVKTMESKEATIQIVTDKATYTLPASQVNIDSITSQFGTDVKLEDIVINIKISDTSDANTKQAQDSAQANGSQLIGLPIDFEITATYGGKSVTANKFNSYVEREIVIPNGIDPNKITTGTVLTQEGKLYHVPTVVVTKNGKTYAVVNSLTNSTYSVIYNPREMTDVSNHWAKADVNDMSSRMIVQGVTATTFDPDASITRAEFSAIVTRGLGIQDAKYTDAYKDVVASDWYAGAVQAAANYKLIEGYEDGSFQPNEKITRQEAAVVLARATSIAKLKSALSAEEVNVKLSAFADGSTVSSWARNEVASAISLELLKGKNGKLDIASNLTRAETAALVRRLLQAANLINK